MLFDLISAGGGKAKVPGAVGGSVSRGFQGILRLLFSGKTEGQPDSCFHGEWTGSGNGSQESLYGSGAGLLLAGRLSGRGGYPQGETAQRIHAPTFAEDDGGYAAGENAVLLSDACGGSHIPAFWVCVYIPTAWICNGQREEGDGASG